MVMVSGVYMYVKINEIICPKYLWFVVHQLHFNKTVKNSPPPPPPPTTQPPKKEIGGKAEESFEIDSVSLAVLHPWPTHLPSSHSWIS